MSVCACVRPEDVSVHVKENGVHDAEIGTNILHGVVDEVECRAGRGMVCEDLYLH